MGEFDLSPDEMKSFNLRPEELHKSKYPGPKQLDDQALGLETGPQERLGVTEPGFPGDVYRPTGDEAKRLHQEAFKRAATGMFADFGGQIAGSALTAGIGEAFAPTVGRAASEAIAPNALSAFAKKGPTTTQKVISEVIEKIMGKTMAQHVAPQAIDFAKREATAAVKSIPAAVGAAVPVAAGGAASKTASPMSNAVERLRASAAGNPRAAELLAKIGATPNPPNLPEGSVTQGTLGSP